jgi:hypothetical protein
VKLYRSEQVDGEIKYDIFAIFYTLIVVVGKINNFTTMKNFFIELYQYNQLVNEKMLQQVIAHADKVSKRTLDLCTHIQLVHLSWDNSPWPDQCAIEDGRCRTGPYGVYIIQKIGMRALAAGSSVGLRYPSFISTPRQYMVNVETEFDLSGKGVMDAPE